MVIDFRVRPPYGVYAEKMFQNLDAREDFANKYGFTSPPSVIQCDMDLFIQELDKAGIDLAVIPGRGAMGTKNEELLEIAETYKGRFVVFPFVNPMEGQGALKDLEKLAEKESVKGFSMEPGVAINGRTFDFDDEIAFPFYEKMQELGLPLMITYSGHTVPEMDSRYVAKLDRVAVQFPNLNIVLSHAGWPWVMELIGMAFRRKNIYLLPDVYGTNSPGSGEFTVAANTLIPDKILFGSAYPIIPVVEAVQFYEKEAGYREDVLEKVMGGNASKLLGLQ